MHEAIKKIERRIKKFERDIELQKDLIEDQKKYIKRYLEANEFEKVELYVKIAKECEMKIAKFEDVIYEEKRIIEILRRLKNENYKND